MYKDKFLKLKIILYHWVIRFMGQGLGHLFYAAIPNEYIIQLKRMNLYDVKGNGEKKLTNKINENKDILVVFCIK